MILDEMRPEDATQVYDLMTQLEGGQPLPRAGFERAFAAYLADADVKCIVARDGERILGFASVHTRLLMHHAAPVSELQELVVADGCRGRGLGKMLLDAARREAVRRGSPQLELCCNRNNESADGFYRHCGMTWTHRKYLWRAD
ncbi:MAG: GNAT family N-acetyltransferase [Clostridia bacterium]|nr:GNAT family N-acetyltransferase [Clostridia bacterium]